MLCLDTCALIDYQREQRRGEIGPATRLLEGHREELYYISIIVAFEFAEGIAPEKQHEFDEFIEPLNILPLERDIVWRAAQIRRQLRQAGTPIGDNDLLIGVTALHHGFEVVTRNSAHFERIPGLAVVSY